MPQVKITENTSPRSMVCVTTSQLIVTIALVMSLLVCLHSSSYADDLTVLIEKLARNANPIASGIGELAFQKFDDNGLLTLDKTATVAFKGENFSIVKKYTTSPEDGVTDTTLVKQTFDGEKLRAYETHSMSDGESWTRGVIRSETKMINEMLLPMTWGRVYGGEHLVSSLLQREDSNGRLLGSEIVNGEVCHRVELDFFGGRTEFLINESKQFVFQEVRVRVQGKLLGKIDIDFRELENGIWFPKSGTFHRYNHNADGEELLFTIKVQFSEQYQVNVPIAAEEFRLQFPPDEPVADLTNGGIPRGGIFSPR